MGKYLTKICLLYVPLEVIASSDYFIWKQINQEISLILDFLDIF